jgi:hypothetical protein
LTTSSTMPLFSTRQPCLNPRRGAGKRPRTCWRPRKCSPTATFAYEQHRRAEFQRLGRRCHAGMRNQRAVNFLESPGNFFVALTLGFEVHRHVRMLAEPDRFKTVCFQPATQKVRCDGVLGQCRGDAECRSIIGQHSPVRCEVCWGTAWRRTISTLRSSPFARGSTALRGPMESVTPGRGSLIQLRRPTKNLH